MLQFQRQAPIHDDGALLAPEALRELAHVRWGDALVARRHDDLRAWWAAVAADRGRGRPGGEIGSHDIGTPPASGELFVQGLSARELEVLARIAAGDSNKVIARAFDLSLHTVKRHVANILGKLGVEARGQAAAWYRRHAQ